MARYEPSLVLLYSREVCIQVVLFGMVMTASAASRGKQGVSKKQLLRPEEQINRQEKEKAVESYSCCSYDPHSLPDSPMPWDVRALFLWRMFSSLQSRGLRSNDRNGSSGSAAPIPGSDNHLRSYPAAASAPLHQTPSVHCHACASTAQDCQHRAIHTQNGLRCDFL